MRDDEFDLEPGKIGNPRSTPGRSYLQRVLHASAQAGPRYTARAFWGCRIGRGSGIGRVLASRDHHAALHARRVIIKSRIVKLAGRGLPAAKAHLRYIQRDGVTREGQPGQLYDAEREGADGKAFLARADGDRHQFRFIVSAEDGAAYDDLKPFVRRLMGQMEADLGTQLDWVAVDHFNTGHPHSHVIVRGKDDRDNDLIIARDYISKGLRERAGEIVAFDLGPRSDLDIETKLRNEVGQERFNGLDRSLLRLAGDDGVIDLTGRSTPSFARSLRLARLKKLESLGLAEETATGRWRIDPDAEAVLRRMGVRGDIIKTMHHALHGYRGEIDPVSYTIHNPASARRLVGEVVARGLSDELGDRSYLILAGTDGHAHYVDIGKVDEPGDIRRGMIVAIRPAQGGVRAADRMIADIAAANGGRYNVDIHLRADRAASAEFAAAHVRRLEALRRSGGLAERDKEGTWLIGPDHLAKVEVYEAARVRQSPVVIETLSRLSLSQQIETDGPTWLDNLVVAHAPEGTSDRGFGRVLQDRMEQRRRWLIAQELALDEDGRFVARANLLAILRRRELVRMTGRLSEELKRPYLETKTGARIEGVYRRSVELASGRYALIERARDFTLVPWRPVLERNLGRTVWGISRGDTISWFLGRQRSGPSIE